MSKTSAAKLAAIRKFYKNKKSPKMAVAKRTRKKKEVDKKYGFLMGDTSGPFMDKWITAPLIIKETAKATTKFVELGVGVGTAADRLAIDSVSQAFFVSSVLETKFKAHNLAVRIYIVEIT